MVLANHQTNRPMRLQRNWPLATSTIKYRDCCWWRAGRINLRRARGLALCNHGGVLRGWADGHSGDANRRESERRMRLKANDRPSM
jgi:hypothetical protein